jgi:hypothetical protein
MEDIQHEGALPNQRNTDYMREYMRKYRSEQGDRYNQYHKDYYQNNKERINARRRELYRAKNGGNDGV